MCYHKDLVGITGLSCCSKKYFEGTSLIICTLLKCFSSSEHFAAFCILSSPETQVDFSYPCCTQEESWCVCLRICSSFDLKSIEKLMPTSFFSVFLKLFLILLHLKMLWFYEIFSLISVRSWNRPEVACSAQLEKEQDYTESMPRNNKFLFCFPLGLGPLCPIPEGSFVPAYKWWEFSGKPPGGCWSQPGK